jgi:hypothetical protein
VPAHQGNCGSGKQQDAKCGESGYEKAGPFGAAGPFIEALLDRAMQVGGQSLQRASQPQKG